MDFDVQELSAEIRQIDREFRQANDRLYEVYGRGRGRGRGRFRGRGRGRFYQRNLAGNESVDTSNPRATSCVIHCRSLQERRPSTFALTVKTPKVMMQRDFIPPVILKRPSNHGMDDDPKIKSRNRRMFSSLLTTLEKFREENDTVEKSERWKKREEMTKRTQQKTAEVSVRLLQKQKKEWEEQKLQETEKLKELDRKRKVKGLQLIYAKRLQHKELLLHYLPTISDPVVYWLPAKHNDTTQEILDASRLLTLQEEQKEKFEKEKERIENDLPLEEELQIEEPKIKSTIHVAEKNSDSAEDEVEMEFKPVSELTNEIAEDVDTSPPIKKPRLDASDKDNKSRTENDEEDDTKGST